MRFHAAVRCLLVGWVLAAVPAAAAGGAAPQWERITAEAGDLLSRYIRIDTANPPGRTTDAWPSGVR